MIHNKPIDTMNILLATAQTVVGLNCQQPLFIADEMVSFVSEERHICLEINRLQRHHTKHGQMKVPWHLSEWELEVMGALGAQQLLSPWSGDLPWTSVCLVLFPHLTREGGWSSEGKISGLCYRQWHLMQLLSTQARESSSGVGKQSTAFFPPNILFTPALALSRSFACMI